MRQLLYSILVVSVLQQAAAAQNKLLWDGENTGPATCTTAYGSILSGPDAHEGDYYFRAEPDNSHSPRIAFNCAGMWRADISRFDELRFYIKSNQPEQTTSIRFATYFAKGNWVDLQPYLQGGGAIGTDYQEVVVPLTALKTDTYNLGSIEFLEFGTTAAQVMFYVDDISLRDQTPPGIKFEPVSNQVAKLHISERPDKETCYTLANYSVSSPTDPDYQNAAHPVKIGRHAFVTALTPQSGSAIVQHELFLIFEKPLTNGAAYTLQVTKLKDPAGNTGTFDTTFTFSDQVMLGNVKVNQVGYLPNSPKLAKLGNFLGDAGPLSIDTINPPGFKLFNQQDEVVFAGTSSFLKIDSLFSGEMVFELDFSSFTTPGKYYIYVAGLGRSESFEIKTDIYDETYFHTARGLFFQRAGTLNQANAGEWARNGLPGGEAEIHASHLNSPLYNDTDFAPGTKIPMQGGWLDAGDYGRYVPTAASALFTLFTAFELYPKKFPDTHLNIPESGNQIPDILDEAKYELDWLKQMQAPDGGVYFRVTPALWSTGMPEQETKTLFVSEKTTQSTAMFAAAMAMAYRNLKNYFPAYADSCLERATKAWAFLAAHQQASAPVSVPGISAGPYPDPEDRDNRAWAAAELYKATGQAGYNTDFLNLYAQIPHEFHATMSWQQHTMKAAWAYATTKFATDGTIVSEFKEKLESEVLASYYDRTMNIHAYRGAYHPFKNYIGYGTFGMAQSYAFDYIMFSYLLQKPELLDLAKIQLDISLGNNPLSKTFITGMGKNNPRLPLHWSTATSQFADPVPGVPVFGPAASLVMNRPSSFAIQDSLNRYPYGFKKEDPYPVLRRYTDAREAVEMSEFTIQEMAVTAAAFAFFSSVVNVALPVRLVSFEVRSAKCRTHLEWTTAEETNADYFAIERSTDSRNFKEIGKVKAAGASSVAITYQFSDPDPKQKSYYRLRQVDFDGKTTLSTIRFAAQQCESVFELVYVERNVFRLAVKQAENANVELLTGTLYDISGAEKHSFKVNTAGSTHFQGNALLPGIYILKVQNQLNESVFTEKLIIY
ncbi:glycoside hydrolase family 9 protein [Dyadobacter sp. Leaf189]|uniref:glycoside hydrolase family 9 protein n=1 Tax=Dyadobacter sp. Leaf189 TaxID=1736295 RepID=UPI000AC50AED|nr:glycoside hydrolase family 9 protein [Dyadobacter sp. Leaf189]